MRRCKLSLEEKRVFLELYRLGQETNREWGLAYCDEDGNVVPNRICRGDRYCVTIKECPDYTKYADVHYHPGGPQGNETTTFSPGDVLQSMRYNMHHSCIIASNKDILCVYGYDKLQDPIKRDALYTDIFNEIRTWQVLSHVGPEPSVLALRNSIVELFQAFHLDVCEDVVDEL